MELNKLASIFYGVFGFQHSSTFFSPGRVNLVGEHIDYNGGNVFPVSITLGTYGLVRKRNDQKFRVYSVNFEEMGIIEFDFSDLSYNVKHNWANYLKGMIKFISEGSEKQLAMTGLDILVYGNIPNGAGLSSSASLEMLMGTILDVQFDLKLNRIEMVKTGKKVENDYIGVNSGIMDQFIIGMGKENHAILLDCQTLSYQYAPIKLENHDLIIMNTNKRRELADSKYNERRNECEQALFELQRVADIKSLGQLNEETFERNKHVLSNETIQKRAKHAVYENQRVIKAFNELKNNNLCSFGELLNLSHVSLRDDYDVTGIELDTIVEAAWKQEGVIGARMTGAGFGGCAIAIVEKGIIEKFIKQVSETYESKIGYKADFYIASIGDGAREITLEES